MKKKKKKKKEQRILIVLTESDISGLLNGFEALRILMPDTLYKTPFYKFVKNILQETVNQGWKL